MGNRNIADTNKWGIRAESLKGSVTAKIRKRMNDKPENPVSSSDTLFGYLRVAVKGDRGLRFMAKLSDICRQKGYDNRNDGMVCALMDRVLEEI